MSKCLACLVDVTTNLKCGRCRVAHYCSRECQVNHYPIHKLICRDGNIKDKLDRYFTKAKNYESQGNDEKAEAQYIKCLALAEEMSEGKLNDYILTIATNICNAKRNQAMYSNKTHKIHEAKALLTEYIDRFISQNSEEIANTSSYILMMRSKLADLLIMEERFDEAEDMLKQVLRIQTAVYGPEHKTAIDTVLYITIISMIIT